MKGHDRAYLNIEYVCACVLRARLQLPVPV